MRGARVSARLLVLLVLGGLAVGCAAHAEPLVPPGTPALETPEPPVRVVVPAPEQPTLPPAEEPPPAASPSTVPAKPPARPPSSRPPATPLPTEPPAPVVVPPPTPLLTSANTAEFEKRVVDQLNTAQAHLAKIDRNALGPDARAQFDAARGFIRQAEEALKVKNLIYAGQLADKAATMAALLRRLSS